MGSFPARGKSSEAQSPGPVGVESLRSQAGGAHEPGSVLTHEALSASVDGRGQHNAHECMPKPPQPAKRGTPVPSVTVHGGGPTPCSPLPLLFPETHQGLTGTQLARGPCFSRPGSCCLSVGLRCHRVAGLAGRPSSAPGLSARLSPAELLQRIQAFGFIFTGTVGTLPSVNLKGNRPENQAGTAGCPTA